MESENYAGICFSDVPCVFIKNHGGVTPNRFTASNLQEIFSSSYDSRKQASWDSRFQ